MAATAEVPVLAQTESEGGSPPMLESSYLAASLLPDNLDVGRIFGWVVLEMLERSGTFRSQTARVAAVPTLQITLELDASMRRFCRAFTTVQRRPNAIIATVHLPLARLASTYPELISHEIEHVLEQVDGLDLKTLSRIPGSGVLEVEPGLFETARAQRAGSAVAYEVRYGHLAPRPPVN